MLTSSSTSEPSSHTHHGTARPYGPPAAPPAKTSPMRLINQKGSARSAHHRISDPTPKTRQPPGQRRGTPPSPPMTQGNAPLVGPSITRQQSQMTLQPIREFIIRIPSASPATPRAQPRAGSAERPQYAVEQSTASPRQQVSKTSTTSKPATMPGSQGSKRHLQKEPTTSRQSL